MPRLQPLVKSCELCYMANTTTDSKLCADCKDVVRHYLHMESCFERPRRDLAWVGALAVAVSGGLMIGLFILLMRKFA